MDVCLLTYWTLTAELFTIPAASTEKGPERGSPPDRAFSISPELVEIHTLSFTGRARSRVFFGGMF